MVYASKTRSVSDFIAAVLKTIQTPWLVDSYIKAEDPSNFAEVIEISSHAGKHDDLVRFLQMARKSLREPKIDTELAYAYAKTVQTKAKSLDTSTSCKTHASGRWRAP